MEDGRPGHLLLYQMERNSLVMNLKETLISSFFFHLILLLVMAAVAGSTGFSWDRQNIVSVDLAREDSKNLHAAGSDSAEKSPAASTPPSDGDVSLPEQAVKNPHEESEEMPASEKKSETEKPQAQARGFTSLEDYHRFIMFHKQIFGQKAGDRVNELLGKALTVNEREFFGGTAVVNLKFGSDGKLSEVLVDSASPELKAFLEEIGWEAIPTPAFYSLQSTGVRIEFAVLEGYLSFNINTL